MNYQVTCTCRNSFLVTPDQAGRDIPCPACGQLLHIILPAASPSNIAPGLPGVTAPQATGSPSTPGAPISAMPVAATLEETKRCPFCGEVILAVARKCKHCGEFLDRAPAPPLPPSPGTGVPGQVPGTSTTDPPVFSLTVSQWDNVWRFLIIAVIALVISVIFIVAASTAVAATGILGTLVIAGFVGYFFYLTTRTSRCFIRPLRIETETGILSKDSNYLELFRVTDIDLKQNLFERLLGIGTIKLTTNDASSPEFHLYQIPQARKVYKYLQDQIPIAAKSRGAIYMEK